MNIIRLIHGYISAQIEASVKEAMKPVTSMVKGIVFSLAAMAVGLALLLMAAGAGGIALFFALANLPYVSAALWTALIYLGGGIILFLLAMVLLRWPK